jgi:hypothetical protein
MTFRRSRSSRTPNQALAEALRRPPLRVELRYEPGDRIDGYPTITLTPCRAVTAIAALDRVELGARTRLIVGGGSLLDPQAGRMRHTDRERLADAAIAGSLATDTRAMIDMSRTVNTRFTIASVDGPVEERDAQAIEAAIAAGACVLDADLRVTAVVQCGSPAIAGATEVPQPSAPVCAQFREAADARRFIAVLTQSYLARSIGEPFDAIAPLGHELFGRCTTGFLLRPHDVRIDGCTMSVKLRRNGDRTTRTITLDRSIGRWF